MATKKKKIYKISVSSDSTLGDLRKKIKEINRTKFGGRAILKLSDDVEMGFDYTGCYYEGDRPDIEFQIPYEDS